MAPTHRRCCVNIAVERARQTDLDAEYLIVSLCQGVKERCWRDDGVLPAMSGLSYRPLTGHEEFMLCGYSLDRMIFAGASDLDAVRFAGAVSSSTTHWYRHVWCVGRTNLGKDRPCSCGPRSWLLCSLG